MLEDLIESVGSSGKFQWMTVFLVMSSKFVFGMSMLVMAYGGLVPEWWCVPMNATVDAIHNMSTSSPYYQFCSNTTTSCLSRTYEAYTSTVVSKFDLVCENAWIKPTVTSVQMGGVLVGAAIGGQSGDMFGRKKTIYLSMLVHTVCNFIIAFSVNWKMFAAFRFFIGASIGTYLVLVVYPVEFVGTKRRALVSAIPFWAVGVLILALASYLMHDWKSLHILIGALTFPYLLGWFIMPESLRWLATKNRLEEAREVLDKIARFNGKTVPENADTILRKVVEIERENNQGKKKYTYLDIYKGCSMLKKSVCIQFMWFSCSSVYYGFSFGLSDFSGNFYLNFFLMNVIELSIFFPVLYLLGKIGRRYTCSGALLIAACCCIATLIIQEVNDITKSPLITGFSLVAKILTGAAWVALIILSNETYPTVIRYLGYGAANTMARIGGILAPFIFSLGSNRMVPYIIMMVLMTVSGLAALLLKETNGEALQDLVEDKQKKIEKNKSEIFIMASGGLDTKPNANNGPEEKQNGVLNAGNGTPYDTRL